MNDIAVGIFGFHPSSLVLCAIASSLPPTVAVSLTSQLDRTFGVLIGVSLLLTSSFVNSQFWQLLALQPAACGSGLGDMLVKPIFVGKKQSLNNPHFQSHEVHKAKIHCFSLQCNLFGQHGHRMPRTLSLRCSKPKGTLGWICMLHAFIKFLSDSWNVMLVALPSLPPLRRFALLPHPADPKDEHGENCHPESQPFGITDLVSNLQ